MNFEILIADSANKTKADIKDSIKETMQEQMTGLIAALGKRPMAPSSSPSNASARSGHSSVGASSQRDDESASEHDEENSKNRPTKKSRVADGDNNHSTGRHRAAQTPLTQLVHTTIKEVLNTPTEQGGLYDCFCSCSSFFVTFTF